MRVTKTPEELRAKRNEYHNRWRKKKMFERRDYMREYMRSYAKTKEGWDNMKRAEKAYRVRQKILRSIVELDDALDNSCI